MEFVILFNLVYDIVVVLPFEVISSVLVCTD